jgi:hypothetical protein
MCSVSRVGQLFRACALISYPGYFDLLLVVNLLASLNAVHCVDMRFQVGDFVQ